MPVSSRTERDEASDEPPAPGTGVSVLRTCPGRSVFIEEGNTDGWISTDLAVDVER